MNRKNNPLVSVVIPTYKRPEMLGRAIDSVLNQTYDNIEIIIVDDNDSDSEYRKETELFIKEYLNLDKLFYLKHTENKGGSAARNTGIKFANGFYIAFLDDDDIWENTKLNKQLSLFFKDESLGLVYCRKYTFDNKNDKVYNKQRKSLPKGHIYKNMLSKNYIGTQTALIKRECFENIGYFDENLLSRQDHDMFLRISKYYKIDFVDEFLVGMGLHNNRISRRIYNKVKGWHLFLKKWKKELNKYPLEKKKLYEYYYFEMAKVFYYHNNFNKSKFYLLKLLKSDKFHFKGIILLVLSFLKIKINLK